MVLQAACELVRLDLLAAKGRWNLSLRANGTAVCTIREVESRLWATWKLTDTHVIITLDNNKTTWWALRLPLDEGGTSVDSWSGMDAYIVKKVPDDD